MIKNTTIRLTGKKRLLLASGTTLGIATLITTAAFTDFANLNLGNAGIGGNPYNIQVIQTDPTTGAQVPGSWQEANTTTGVPIAISGANAIFPGSPDITVTIPTKNASTSLKSSLQLALTQIPDTPTKITSPDYLKSLQFDISQPATTITTTALHATNLSFTNLNSLNLNSLAPGETSNITITIRLLPQTISGASYTDNSLNGATAYLQAHFVGSSIS